MSNVLSCSSFFISIHAPRAGSDSASFAQSIARLYFNPCSPCGERLNNLAASDYSIKFQSMLPVRGATSLSPANFRHHRISIHAPRAGSDSTTSRSTPWIRNFNPCSPWGERPVGGVGRDFPRGISIHAPRAGSDFAAPEATDAAAKFQSMLPVRGATPILIPAIRLHVISIHAPRAGSDSLAFFPSATG